MATNCRNCAVPLSIDRSNVLLPWCLDCFAAWCKGALSGLGAGLATWLLERFL